MSRSSSSAAIATLGIDLGKNSFHLVGQDERGAIVLRIKLSRPQLTQRLANIPPCLIGMEACAGAHHWPPAGPWPRRAADAGPVRPAVRQDPPERPDRYAEAIAEAVQRPQCRFVPIKTPAQLDVQALHWARERLVGSAPP